MASVAFSGCPGPAKVVVEDLAASLAFADHWSTREVVLFGTPSAEPCLREGFYTESGGVAGDPFLWARGEAELALAWTAAEPRTAVLDLRPYEAVRGQKVEVRLNGAPIDAFALNDGRFRYLVSLPAAAQKAGENRLRFVFAQTASPAAEAGNADRRQLAAAFHSIVIGPSSDPTLQDLLGRGAPAPAAARVDGGVPAIEQIAPSALRFALRLPAGAELRFTPALHRAAVGSDGAVSMRVTIEGTSGGERELWSRVLRARDGASREVSVALPGATGDVVRLALYAGGAPADRFAWAVWTAPRVLGRDAPPGKRANVPEDDRRADSLRAGAARFNVVLVILDAARAQEFGTYGYGRATTPEIDRIATEGVVFDRAYTPAVFTLGALASLWTSQYPDRHHAEVSYADPLPRDRLTLAEGASARGVRTAGFVVTRWRGHPRLRPRVLRVQEVYKMFPDLGSRGAAFQRVLPPWLAAHAGERFFAYVHFREPHFPYDPGPPFDTRFGPDAPLGIDERRDRAWYTDVNQGRRVPTAEEIAHLVRLYDGNLASADHRVGALRRSLQQQGLWAHTVLVVATDHGGSSSTRRGTSATGAQVFEQSTHVPLIVRVPGGPRGTRVAALVDLLDLAPTILDLFGLRDTPFAQGAQGASLLPLVAGAGRGDALTLSRTVWERPVYALRDGTHKLVYDTRTGQQQLFAIEEDRQEAHDLAPSEPVRASYYRQTLLRTLAGLKRTRPAASGAAGTGTLTPEQCENLKSLGYADARCK